VANYAEYGHEICRRDVLRLPMPYPSFREERDGARGENGIRNHVVVIAPCDGRLYDRQIEALVLHTMPGVEDRRMTA